MIYAVVSSDMGLLSVFNSLEGLTLSVGVLAAFFPIFQYLNEKIDLFNHLNIFLGGFQLAEWHHIFHWGFFILLFYFIFSIGRTWVFMGVRV